MKRSQHGIVIDSDLSLIMKVLVLATALVME